MRACIIKVAIVFSLALPSLVNAALITHINDLNVDGTLYDVTFHTNTSFTTLFDPDNDGIFGEGDGAIINHAPTFLGNDSLARAAAASIIGFLGIDNYTIERHFTTPVPSSMLSDQFHIPERRTPSAPVGTISLGPSLFAITDFKADLGVDQVAAAQLIPSASSDFIVYATFEQSNTVPAPSSFALAGLALMIMGVIGYRRRVS